MSAVDDESTSSMDYAKIKTGVVAVEAKVVGWKPIGYINGAYTFVTHPFYNDDITQAYREALTLTIPPGKSIIKL